MIKKLSSKRANNLSFIGLIVLLFFIYHEYSQVRKPDDYYVVILLAVIFLYFLYCYFRIGTLSYDEENVYIDKFFYKVTIPIDSILKITRSIGSVLSSTNLEFGYRLSYIKQNGKRNYFIFFVVYSGIAQIKEFTNLVTRKNPSVVVDLKE
jgi:hypothetical protein